MKKYLILFCLFFSISYGFEKVHYPLEKGPIDVVIPCAEKDRATLERCIKGIHKNGENIRRIIVVSSHQLTQKAEWFDENNYPFNRFDIALQLLGNEEEARAFSSGNTRLGWIHAQLLKLYAPLVIPDISSNVLIIDADTIFLNPVSFQTESGGGLYNPGTEHHQPYFDHMERLIPGLRKVFPMYSGISHHMLFQRSVMQDLFATIESIHHVEAWKALCRCIDLAHLHMSSMADYEIYFNFAFSRSDQMRIRPLKWINNPNIEKLDRLKRKGYIYASCHSWHRGN